jgi:ubiquitin carboxyl-terminal hydrolase 34
VSDQGNTIVDQLIARCMAIIKDSEDSFQLERVMRILKNLIYDSEKKGTGDVRPHFAILRGELIEDIYIKNKVSWKKGDITISIHSNSTVWEFKKLLSSHLEVVPKYLKLERGDGRTLQDTDNGKTIKELGICHGETISASKMQVEEEVPNALLIGNDNHLTPKAKEIFSEWFYLYSEESGFTKNSCARFIKGCTGELPPVTDDRVVNLFKSYDSNKDERLELDEFLSWYE